MLTYPMKTMTRILMLAVLFTGLTASAVRAQDDQEHKKAYNAGLEAAKANNYDDAYEAFQKAASLSEQAGDEEVLKKAQGILTQIDNLRGNALLKQENWSQAIEHFERGIEHDPAVAKNYYGKGLALKNLERFDEAVEVWNEAIAMAEAEGDSRTASTASEAIRKHYIFLASSSLAGSGQNPTRAGATEALQHLEAMQEHVEQDADALYYTAEAHKVLGEYDQAIAAADAALELHRGSKSDKAKIYFVKGESLMLSGDNDAAKLAFEEAQYGSFKASAQHYLETL